MQYSEECIGTCGFSGSIICERDDKSVQNRKLLANKIFNKTRAHKYFAGENSKNETKKPKKISKKCISDLQVLTLASFNILFIVNSCYKKQKKPKMNNAFVCL